MLTLVGNRDRLYKELVQKVKKGGARHSCVVCGNLWKFSPDYFSFFNEIWSKLPVESEDGDVAFVEVWREGKVMKESSGLLGSTEWTLLGNTKGLLHVGDHAFCKTSQQGYMFFSSSFWMCWCKRKSQWRAVFNHGLVGWAQKLRRGQSNWSCMQL